MNAKHLFSLLAAAAAVAASVGTAGAAAPSPEGPKREMPAAIGNKAVTNPGAERSGVRIPDKPASGAAANAGK